MAANKIQAVRSIPKFPPAATSASPLAANPMTSSKPKRLNGQAYFWASIFAVASGYMFWKPLLEEQAKKEAELLNGNGQTALLETTTNLDAGSSAAVGSETDNASVPVQQANLSSRSYINILGHVSRFWDRIGPHTI